jgi:hypothetical protein
MPDCLSQSTVFAGFRVDGRRAKVDARPGIGAQHRPESIDEDGLVQAYRCLYSQRPQSRSPFLERALGGHQGADDLLGNGPGVRLVVASTDRGVCAKAGPDGNSLSVTFELCQLGHRSSLCCVCAHDRSRRCSCDHFAAARFEARLAFERCKDSDLPRDTDFAAAAENQPDFHLVTTALWSIVSSGDRKPPTARVTFPHAGVGERSFLTAFR